MEGIRQVGRVVRSDAVRVCVGAAFALVFWISGFYHAKNPFAFLLAALQYELLFPSFVSVCVSILPCFQLALATCLVFRSTRRFAFATSAALLACFAGAQCYAYFSDLEIDCGCFGAAFSKPVTLVTIIPVVAFSALSAVFASTAGSNEGQ